MNPNLTDRQKEALETLQSSPKAIKCLMEIINSKKEEKLLGCRFAQNRQIVQKNDKTDIIITETASEYVKGSLEFIKGMQWVIDLLLKPVKPEEDNK